MVSYNEEKKYISNKHPKTLIIIPSISFKISIEKIQQNKKKITNNDYNGLHVARAMIMNEVRLLLHAMI